MDAFEQDAELSRRTIRCAPFPGRWKKFSESYNLAWERHSFRKASARSVPDAPGIYCFVVGHDFPSVPVVGYALYVGVTGISKRANSLRTLRKRFGEYLKEKDSPKGRWNVRKFLNAFDGELIFFCAPTNISAAALERMEKELNDALMPPYSIKDFTAEVRARRSAWQ